MPVAVKEQELAGPYVATLGALSLSVIAPILICSATPEPKDGTWMAILVVLVASGLRLAWIVGEAKRRLVEFSFWLFVYAFFGVAPLVQLRTGQTPGTTPGTTADQNATAALIIAVGCAAFIVGAWIAQVRSTSLDDAADLPRVGRKRVFLVALTALALDAYYVYGVGIGALLSSRDELSHVAASRWPNSTNLAILQAAVSVSLLVAFVALVALRRQASIEGSPKPLILPTVVLGVLLFTINPISSARYVAGTVLLAVAASLGLYSTRSRFRAVSVAIVLGLVFLFPAAAAFRHVDQAQVNVTDPFQTLTTGDFDAFAQVSNTALYVDQSGTTSGRQALGVVLFWVPRSVWEDKPVDTGVLLAQSRGYQFTNLSAPLPAELYINGSWPLLLLGMFGFGWFARRADHRISRTFLHQKAPGVLACILPFYMIIVLRGSLLQSMAYLVVIVGVARLVRRRPDAQGSATHDGVVQGHGRQRRSE